MKLSYRNLERNETYVIYCDLGDTPTEAVIRLCKETMFAANENDCGWQIINNGQRGDLILKDRTIGYFILEG